MNYWCNNLDESPENFAEWEKKTITKGYTLYDSMYIAFLKWQIIEMEGRLVVARGWGVEDREEANVATQGQQRNRNGLRHCWCSGCDIIVL